jgi:hypothetical protein
MKTSYPRYYVTNDDVYRVRARGSRPRFWWWPGELRPRWLDSSRFPTEKYLKIARAQRVTKAEAKRAMDEQCL